MDTDLLLGLLVSLLEPPIPENSALLDALAQADGDVDSAARLLRTRPTAQKGVKRKRSAGLDGWLTSPSKNSKETEHNSIDAKPSSSSSARPPQKKPLLIKETAPSRPSQTSHAKPPSINDVLRSPTKSADPPKPQRLVPRILATPALVAEHTSCTLHTSVLPPELASRLYYALLDASNTWTKNKWWLFERLVESPHKTTFFTRFPPGSDQYKEWRESANFWYNGNEESPAHHFLPEMEEACVHIERVVNDEIKKRPPFPLEWIGPSGRLEWHANVAAANRYDGTKESVGFHSDQLTHLGPYATIASLSLGVTRNFRLREVVPKEELPNRQAQTFNIPVSHNTLTIMHASTQEKFKHSIPPQSVLDAFRPAHPRPNAGPDDEIESSNSRINVTFRFFRPDFRPSTLPKCKCGFTCALRPDMKGRGADGLVRKYWWACFAGARNEGKGCNFWKVMDMKEEKRGPFYRPTIGP